MRFNNRLFRQLFKSRAWFPALLLVNLLIGLLIILQSQQLSKVVNGAFLKQLSLFQLKPLLIGIAGIILLRFVFHIFMETITAKLAVRIKNDLRESIFKKISALGAGVLRGEKIAGITTTTLQGVDTLDIYFSQYLPQVLLSVMLPVLTLLFVFPLDWLTGVVLAITAPLIPLFMMLIGWVAEALTKKQWELLTHLSDYFLDTLQGIATLKTLGRGKDRLQSLQKNNDLYRNATMDVLKVSFLSALVLELIATLSTAIVAVEIGLRLLNGRLGFESAFFILLIAPEFYQPLRNLSQRFHAGMKGVAAAQDIYNFLDVPTIAALTMGGVNEDLSNPLKGPFSLSFDHVSFAHPDRSDQTLDCLSFKIEKGKNYAIVGPSGGGKSTVVQLLLRFLVPVSGEIQINGINIQDFKAETWRESIAWVGQKPTIFNTSLLENVRLWHEDYPASEIIKALNRAGLREVISRLPDGITSQLGENGSLLSGGEAQRVAIARAILKDSPLLVMDEPTANLDPLLEDQLVTTLENLSAGRTTLTIAHRLRTIQRADRIFVVDRGRLVDEGNHLELLKSCELYRKLVESSGKEG
jgi:ATP-binding cassette, subfamily C, bacterial CydD